MDIHPRYVDVAVLRWQRYTSQTAVLDGDGRTFDEIACVRRRNAPKGEFRVFRAGGARLGHGARFDRKMEPAIAGASDLAPAGLQHRLRKGPLRPAANLPKTRLSGQHLSCDLAVTNWVDNNVSVFLG
jgi:hypothetical protein